MKKRYSSDLIDSIIPHLVIVIQEAKTEECYYQLDNEWC